MSLGAASQGGHAVITEKHGEHDFEKVVLVHPTAKSQVEIYRHGATVTSWKIMGQELLYLSPKAVFAPGKAIRGGIPVVFPQFGPGMLPQHGFARNSTWQLGETNVVKATGDISTSFILEDSPATRAIYPHHFRLTLTVMLKPTALSMQLRVENRNADMRSMPFTTLLHTYLQVEDVLKTTVRGLQNRQYVDQVDGKKIKEDRSEAVIFRGEVDRMYIQGAASPVRLNDGGNCELMVKTTGFEDFVIWNPADTEKTRGMTDLAEGDWKKFVCIEAGQVIEPVVLAAGAAWEGAQGISIQMVADSDVAQAVTQQQMPKL